MIYLLLSVFLFSFNNVLWKKNLQAVSVSYLIAYRAFFTTLLAFVVLNYLDIKWQLISGFGLFRVVLGSLFGVLGLFCMLQVIKYAPLKWVGIYNLIGILFTAIYLYLFEDINMIKTIPGLILMIGGFVFYLSEPLEKQQNLNLKQHLLMGLMVIGFGMSWVLHWKNLSDAIPPIFIIFQQEMVVFLVSFLVLVYNNSIKTIVNISAQIHWLKVLAMAIVIFLAIFFSFIGLQATNPLISSVLILATPLLTIVFGALFFKEIISLTHWISIVVMALGAFWVHYQTT